MSKEISIEERIARGDWAKALLDHPYFVGLCNGIVADAMAGLLSAQPGSDQAKQLHMEMLAADRTKGALTKLVNDATMARNQIKTQHSRTP